MNSSADEQNRPAAPIALAERERVLLEWLSRARAALGADGRLPLAYDELDVMDVVRGELLTALQHSARRTNHRAPGRWQRWLGEARLAGYRLRQRLRNHRAAGHSALPAKATVLFWPRHFNHVDAQLPVQQALSQMGITTAVLACQPAVLELLIQRGEAAVFSRAAWPQPIREARRRASRMAADWRRAAPPELPPLHGDWTARDAWRVLQATFTALVPAACEAIATARAALAACRPQVLVVGYDWTLEGRAGCLVARSLGIPTVCLAHGMIFDSPTLAHRLADYQLVYGEASRRLLIARGLSPSRVVVCGAPYLDRRPRQSGVIDPALARRCTLAAGRPWVLVATSGPGHSVSTAHHQATVRAVAKLSAAAPELTVVVKLHPKDRPEFYRQAERDVPQVRWHVLRHGTQGLPATIFGWLQGCSLLVTGASTAAVEAMLLDVPVLTIDLADELSAVDFIARGATHCVRRGDELTTAVREMLARGPANDALRGRAEEYLRDAYLALDGQSARRAAEAIAALMTRATTAADASLLPLAPTTN